VVQNVRSKNALFLNFVCLRQKKFVFWALPERHRPESCAARRVKAHIKPDGRAGGDGSASSSSTGGAGSSDDLEHALRATFDQLDGT